MQRQVVTTTPQVAKYVVSETTAGEYQLNTTTGNRPERQPRPGQPATVALLLASEEVPTVRVVIQDPATDLVLYQSEDIPVRLGI